MTKTLQIIKYKDYIKIQGLNCYKMKNANTKLLQTNNPKFLAKVSLAQWY